LKFAERARTEWLRHHGIEQATLAEQEDCLFVVADVRLELKKPARLDDALSVSVNLLEQKGATLLLEQEIKRGEVTLALCSVTIACVNSQLRPKRIPLSVSQKIDLK
jgi:acyl-CoA thioester hydrolase